MGALTPFWVLEQIPFLESRLLSKVAVNSTVTILGGALLGRDALASFLRARIADMHPGEIPSDLEREDLEHRLWEASYPKALQQLHLEGACPEEGYQEGYQTILDDAWPRVLEAWRCDNGCELAARRELYRLQTNQEDFADNPKAEGLLALRLKELLRRHPQVFRVPPEDELRGLGKRSGLFKPEADLADFIKELPFPDARTVAGKLSELWSKKSDAQEEWTDPICPHRLLALALWPLSVQPELKRDADKSVPIKVRRSIAEVETVAGVCQFTPVLKVVEHLSPFFGGPCQPGYELNGEFYATQPNVAPEAMRKAIRPGVDSDGVHLAIRPKNLAIIPERHLEDPQQFVLEGFFDCPWKRKGQSDGEEEELIVELARTASNLPSVPPIVPKLLVQMFASSSLDGLRTEGRLGDLGRILYPDLKSGRNFQKRDLARIGEGLSFIRCFCVVEKTDGGALHPYQFFIVDYEWSANPDAKVGWCLNPFLAERMRGGAGGGFFLVNHTRLMMLSLRNPRLFALALRLAGMWNRVKYRGVFKSERFKEIDVDHLAFLTNTLPQSAAEFINGKDTGRNARSRRDEARRDLIDDLEFLQKAGLVGDINTKTPHGRVWTVRPLPDPDMLNAYRRAIPRS